MSVLYTIWDPGPKIFAEVQERATVGSTGRCWCHGGRRWVLNMTNHLWDNSNVGIAMINDKPPMKLMVGIPPIKMVMTGGWFMTLLYQQYTKFDLD